MHYIEDKDLLRWPSTNWLSQGDVGVVMKTF